MKKFNDWISNLDSNEITWLTAIFLSAMLGTLMSGLVLKAGMESFGSEVVWVNLLISLAATAVYTAVVLVIFSIIFPETVPALKQALIRRKQNGRQ